MIPADPRATADNIRAAERARIVAWLRTHPSGWTDEYDDMRAEVLLIADLIEGGAA